MNMQITKKDVAAARRVYWWLLLTPFVSVPIWLCSSFFFMLSANGKGALGSALISAVVSLVFYAPVFIWAVSSNPFLAAHARQGVFLLLLRFGSAFVFGFFLTGDSMPGWSFVLPLFNGLLWLLGFIIGYTQAGNGRAALDDITAEIIPDAPAKAAPAFQSGRDVKEQYLNAFRNGTDWERAQATKNLEALGQMETF